MKQKKKKNNKNKLKKYNHKCNKKQVKKCNKKKNSKLEAFEKIQIGMWLLSTLVSIILFLMS